MLLKKHLEIGLQYLLTLSVLSGWFPHTTCTKIWSPQLSLTNLKRLCFVVVILQQPIQSQILHWSMMQSLMFNKQKRY